MNWTCFIDGIKDIVGCAFINGILFALGGLLVLFPILGISLLAFASDSTDKKKGGVFLGLSAFTYVCMCSILAWNCGLSEKYARMKERRNHAPVLENINLTELVIATEAMDG